MFTSLHFGAADGELPGDLRVRSGSHGLKGAFRGTNILFYSHLCHMLMNLLKSVVRRKYIFIESGRSIQAAGALSCIYLRGSPLALLARAG